MNIVSYWCCVMLGYNEHSELLVCDGGGGGGGGTMNILSCW